MEPKDLSLVQQARSGAGGLLKRRGLIAGAAALATGLMARVSTKTVEANDNNPILAGVANTSTAITQLQRSQPGSTFPAFLVTSDAAAAISATGSNAVVGLAATSTSGNAISASSTSGVAIFATSAASGISGQCTGGQSGVIGSNTSSGVGTSGQSSGGFGVFGTSGASSGVFGQSTATGGIGVQGTSNSGPGLRGDSASNNGVIGTSNSGVGTFGSSGSGFAIFGQSSSGIGIFGQAPTAGRFDGDVVVNGNFSATGTKSAVVVAKDGEVRKLYCLEAPDSWFEDMSEAALAGGPTTIEIDQGFASVVDLDSQYHVFLTPHGDCNGLYVGEKTNHSFVVGELRGGTSSVPFSFRIVAKRRDVEAPRLERVAPLQRVQPQSIPPAPKPPTLDPIKPPADIRLHP